MFLFNYWRCFWDVLLMENRPNAELMYNVGWRHGGGKGERRSVKAEMVKWWREDGGGVEVSWGKWGFSSHDVVSWRWPLIWFKFNWVGCRASPKSIETFKSIVPSIINCNQTVNRITGLKKKTQWLPPKCKATVTSLIEFLRIIAIKVCWSQKWQYMEERVELGRTYNPSTCCGSNLSSQCSHTLKHTLLYCVFYPKWDHHLQNIMLFRRRPETGDYMQKLIRKLR